MISLGKRELLVVAGGLLLFLGLLVPALLFARQETRDGIRRDEVAAFKQVLEQYYNKHEAYPLEFDASPHQYIVVKASEGVAESWFIRAAMENPHEPEAAFDFEAGRNYHFRYVQIDGVTYYDVCGGMPRCDLPTE